MHQLSGTRLTRNVILLFAILTLIFDFSGSRVMAESARVTNTCTFNLTIDKKLLALRQATIDITVPSGYEISDLRKLTASLSGKADGIAAKTFENAFIGGEALDLDGLFKKLGIRCDSKANCDLLELSKSDTNTRSKLFRAER